MDSKKRILIVEDEPGLCRAIARILVREGFDVDAASSGADALRIAEHVRYDLAILDCNLGDMSGTVTSMFLRDRWPGLKVIFTSGADVELVERGEFLRKPWTFEELLAAVRRQFES